MLITITQNYFPVLVKKNEIVYWKNTLYPLNTDLEQSTRRCILIKLLDLEDKGNKFFSQSTKKYMLFIQEINLYYYHTFWKQYFVLEENRITFKTLKENVS